MKSFTFFLLIAGAILISSPLKAQPKPGIKAGVNYGGLSGYEGGKKAAIHTGLFIEWQVNNKWKFRPELLYSSIGQKYMVEEIETQDTKAIQISYVSVPVVFQYYLARKIFIEAGPQLSFLASAKDKGGNGDKADVRRNLRNTQFGFNAGMGWLIRKKTEVYIRYSPGFDDITLYDTDTDCSRLIQAGVCFQLK